MGVQVLHPVRWFFRDEVKRVYCVKRKGILADMGVDVDDIFLTTVEFEHGGVAQMENGWITPNGNGNVNDFCCDVLCTKGQVKINASNHNLIECIDENRSTTPDILVQNFVFGKCKGLSYESIRDFVDRLVDGQEFRVTLEDARKTAIALIAVHESAEKREPVEVHY